MRIWLIICLVAASTRVYAIDLDGNTDFAHRLDLNSSISSRVESIHTSVGKQVSAGELLLTLDKTSLRADADIARAEVDSLAPMVAKMLTELEKSIELFDRDSLALVELQTAEQNYAVARAHHTAAEAKLARALHRLSQTEIESPIRGIVLSVDTFPGHYINTRVGDPTLLTIADNRSMIATALLPIELLGEKLLDRPASIRYREQNYRGKVIQVSRQIITGSNNHPAMTLVIKFETDGKLPAGLPVKIAVDPG